jgi:hypothetical protein
MCRINRLALIHHRFKLRPRRGAALEVFDLFAELRAGVKNPLEACNSKGHLFLRGPAGRAKGVA